jgi:Amt family ammonium transporter
MVFAARAGPVDDSLDVFAVHGIGGATGAVLTGIFATGAIKASGLNAAAAPGLLEGGVQLFARQTGSVFVVAVFSFVMTFFILKVVDAMMGIRVDEESEEMGLDLSQHGEEAYAPDVAEIEVPATEVAAR